MKILTVIMIVFMPAADGGVATVEFNTMKDCLAAKTRIESSIRAGAFHPVAICIER